jgi:hypothetical protein
MLHHLMLFCAQLVAPALVPRPSAVYPQEDAACPDLMAAIMGMTVQVSNVLV